MPPFAPFRTKHRSTHDRLDEAPTQKYENVTEQYRLQRNDQQYYDPLLQRYPATPYLAR